jgi:hypothetical protein
MAVMRTRLRRRVRGVARSSTNGCLVRGMADGPLQIVEVGPYTSNIPTLSQS